MEAPPTVIAGHDGTARGMDAVAHAREIAREHSAHLLVAHVFGPSMS